MKLAASMRFLGLPTGSPPRRLLGLPAGALTIEAIDAALARQRQKVTRHPAAEEPSAQRLLEELDEAAEFLRRQTRGEPVGPAPIEGRDVRRRPAPQAAARVEPTEFDRAILATLVASGGWNRRSRVRIQALAYRHGVQGPGLAKVMRGLAESMRSGSLVVAAPSRPSPTDFVAWRPAEPSRLTVAFEQLDEALAREVAGDTPARLVRLVVAFVAVAAIGSWLLVRALSEPPVPVVVAPPPIDPAEAARIVAPPEAPPIQIDRPDVVRPAKWAKPPRLDGGPPPAEATAALREAARAPERLAALGRKLQLAANRPSAADLREWTTVQEELGRSWPLLDPASRAAAIEAGAAALRPIENDEVAAQFLATWRVEFSVVDEPLGPWLGAWNAGMLAEVAIRPSSTAAIAAQAIDRLDASVPRRALLRVPGMTVFESAAGAWLDRAARPMALGTAIDAGSPARWERWLDAQSALRSGAALQGAYLDAIGAVLASGIDLVSEGRGADLLGRLVQIVDWTERAPDPQRPRDAMTLWFTDDALPARRLWVLTSLLDLSYDAAWFVPAFVLDPDAARTPRGELLERILAAWPAPRKSGSLGGGIVVDRLRLERWRNALQAAGAASAADDAARLAATVSYARLGAAALAFAAGDLDTGSSLLVEAEQILTALPDQGAAAAPGRAGGSDGEFAAAYEAVGRDEAKRRDELRALSTRPLAGDLGPRDAEVLVGEALRATPAEVRVLAQSVFTDRFASGPTALLELLDQLPGMPQTDQLAQFLETVVGGRLPEARSSDFMRIARLALVRKLLALEEGPRHAIDSLAQSLAGAYVDQGRMLRIGFEEPPPDIAPEAMLARLVSQWRLQAGSMFLSEPFPGTLEELDRRRSIRLRLAEDPLQRAVAEQTARLELAVLAAIARKPAIRAQAAAILAEASERRDRAGDVIEQLLDGERAFALLFALLLEPPGESRAPGGAT